ALRAIPFRSSGNRVGRSLAKFIPVNFFKILEHRRRLAPKPRPSADQAKNYRDYHSDRCRRPPGSSLPLKWQRHEVSHNAPSRDRSGRNTEQDSRRAKQQIFERVGGHELKPRSSERLEDNGVINAMTVASGKR